MLHPFVVEAALKTMFQKRMGEGNFAALNMTTPKKTLRCAQSDVWANIVILGKCSERRIFL